MKNDKIKFAAISVLTLIFTGTSLLFMTARLMWYDIAFMVITDVILSLASCALLILINSDKKTYIKALTGIIGFLFPNVFTWGAIMGLNKVIGNGTTMIGISMTALLLIYALLVISFGIKNTKSVTTKVISVVLGLIMIASCVSPVSIAMIKDSVESYDSAVESVKQIKNDFKSAIPQTEIYNMINKHFSSPLADGKTEKKCIVIGYDGTRADVLSKFDGLEKSAISDVLDMGGSISLGYCGGVNWPEKNTQATSTAPGWCSILTGEWADQHGIYENYVNKSNDHLTLLTTLAENKTIDSSKFCVSWDSHFSNDKGTYTLEKQYCEDNHINTQFIDAKNDNGTLNNVLTDVKEEACSDFLFCIFEHGDHCGHQSGFNVKNPGYVKAFERNESFGDEIIKTIQSRETYDKEDWLIIITTDHGGINLEHGGDSKQERYTFICANKESF